MAYETQLWQWLREGLLRHNPPNRSIRLERLESPITPGFPDVDYTYLGTDGKIELKTVDLPTRPQTRVMGPLRGLSQDQMNWHKRHFNAGGTSFVFLRADPWRWLVRGQIADSINEFDADQFKQHALVSIAGHWHDQDWTLLLAYLLSGRHGQRP
jgi:hypothetical protein